MLLLVCKQLHFVQYWVSVSNFILFSTGLQSRIFLLCDCRPTEGEYAIFSTGLHSTIFFCYLTVDDLNRNFTICFSDSTEEVTMQLCSVLAFVLIYVQQAAHLAWRSAVD